MMTPPAYVAYVSPVAHVIVLIQENRSFNTLFMGYPGATTVAVDPYKGVVLTPNSLANAACLPPHHHAAFVADYDGGAMDGWDASNTLPCTAYAYAPTIETMGYWTLAAANVLGDETFQPAQSDGYPAHLYSFAGRSCSYPGDIQCISDTCSGDFCYCGGVATTTTLDMTSAYPGTPTTGAATCKTFTNTIFDELTTAGLTWKWVTCTLCTDSEWGGPTSDSACWASTPCKNKVVEPSTTVLTDISGGTLPSVEYVIAAHPSSDHTGDVTVATAGPTWVNSVVSAVQGSATYANNTTILITWDHGGGWYDSVLPLSPPPLSPDPLEYGFRVPLIVISPYLALRGTVDHTPRSSFGSILRYIETTFGLGSLGQVDSPAATDDLTQLFTYSKHWL